MPFADLQVQILEEFVEASSHHGARGSGRFTSQHFAARGVGDGSLFYKRSAGYFILTANAVWTTFDPAESEIDPWDWRRNNAGGILKPRKMRPYGRRQRKTREILAQLRQDRATQRALRAGMVSACGQ